MKECFECGATEELQEHHVVPKSRGGTKTVTLCYSCHMKAHGRDSKGMKHNRLCKEGVNKAIKKHGKSYWGNQKGVGLEKARETSRNKAQAFAEKTGKLALEMRESGHSWQQIVDHYNQLGISPRRSDRWHVSPMRNMVVRLQSKKNNLSEDK